MPKPTTTHTREIHLTLDQSNQTDYMLLDWANNKSGIKHRAYRLGFIGGSHKLINMLLHQKSPRCKLGLGEYNHGGEFNKPVNFVKASIPLREDCTHKASTSKKGHSILSKGMKPLQVPNKGISFSMLQGRRRNLDISQAKGRSYNMSPPPMLQGDHQLVIFVIK